MTGASSGCMCMGVAGMGWAIRCLLAMRMQPTSSLTACVLGSSCRYLQWQTADALALCSSSSVRVYMSIALCEHCVLLASAVCSLQVILLLQTNVTARVELENRLADLTDAQLSMLEQLFPRHVIEYMLSNKHAYNSRNLTHLAHQHDNVVVLFTDVVGFTTMSKEVQPSQVCGCMVLCLAIAVPYILE